jgi:hypothetical protein
VYPSDRLIEICVVAGVGYEGVFLHFASRSTWWRVMYELVHEEI